MKQLGARTGNWLTQDQARLLLEKANGDDLRSARNLAMLPCSWTEDCARLNPLLLQLRICQQSNSAPIDCGTLADLRPGIMRRLKANRHKNAGWQ